MMMIAFFCLSGGERGRRCSLSLSLLHVCAIKKRL
jgi:hypothetical protein